MSKKSFYTISWKETGILLLLDILVLALATYLYYQNCISAVNVIIINPYLTCTIQFFFSFQNILLIFVAFLTINFGLSLIWHFKVKK